MVTQTLPETKVVEQFASPVEEATEHPHVVWRQDTFRKKLVISGSRIQIWLIASFYKHGDSPEAIHRTYPHLKRAAIYDAISYYLDHQAEVDAEIESNTLENVLKKHNGRITKGGFIEFDPEPQPETQKGK